MDSKTAQKIANELQRKAAYSSKESMKSIAARNAQRIADRIRKEEKLIRRMSRGPSIDGANDAN